jgi:hypothetical protein
MSSQRKTPSKKSAPAKATTTTTTTTTTTATSPLDHGVISASVAALAKHHGERKASQSGDKVPLFDDSDPVLLVISCRQAPPAALRPIPM